MFRAIFCPSSGALDHIYLQFVVFCTQVVAGGGPECRDADCVFGVEGAAWALKW
jgi:hypothetical protein